jgi:hypothetical protein
LKRSSAIDSLRTTTAIRDRAAALYAIAQQDQLTYFQLDPDRWDAVTQYVEQVTRQAYPDLAIPFHSRWRHFSAATLAAVLGDLRGEARAKAQIDLVIPSVLLDAGAGDRWTYVDAFGQSWSRSQGLAVASLEMFAQGLFSHTGARETTAIGLQQITLAQLAQAFQVSATNPLVGLEGRLMLLHRLGATIGQQPEIFGARLVPKPFCKLFLPPSATSGPVVKSSIPSISATSGFTPNCPTGPAPTQPTFPSINYPNG